MPDLPPITVIVTGTDPASNAGGISHALQGFLAALARMPVTTIMIPTHHPYSIGGKWLPWLRALVRLPGEIRGARAGGRTPIVYSHAGAAISLARELMLLRIAHIAGARTMLHVHAPEVEGYLSSLCGRLALRAGLSCVDHVCALTQWWERKLAVLGRPTSVVPNPLPPGVESAAQAPIPYQKAGNGTLALLCMTRLVHGKGADLMLKALTLLPRHVMLTIAGDGPELPGLRSLSETLGVSDRVVFAGWVSGSEKARLLETSDLYCLPSTLDSFGMGFIEAMAYGVPVVAVNQGAIGDVVPHGQAGILVNAPEPAEIADAICELADPKRRAQFGQYGQQWARARFSSGAVADSLIRVLAALSR